MPPEHDLLRSLPSVDSVLQRLTEQGLATGVPRRLLTEAVREAIHACRERLIQPVEHRDPLGRQELTRQIVRQAGRTAREWAGPRYRKAINATGIILHTGLGRAVLPPLALSRIRQELAGYSVLQVDIQSGKRSRRDARIQWLAARLTGAQSATVVNNNAAATLIVLNTVARGREVIVSRGQLVEIGGSFRLPEVMALSGARLVEVGTTNKTHARDYEQAINEQTAAILRVHPSNYRIEGFTTEVPLTTLVEIAHANNLPLIDDVGAGALIDCGRFGLPSEPTLPDSVQAGADLILCSTDKMIGGAQGGLILGRADLVDAVRKNPLARALRVDKITLSVLEATLTLFLDEALALQDIPTLRMMQRPPAEIRSQAERIANGLRQHVPGKPVGGSIEVIEGFSQMGSGSLPGHDLPTYLVAIEPPVASPAEPPVTSPAEPSGTEPPDADQFALRLRRYSPPVFARIAKGRVLLDLRTVLPGEEEHLIEAVKSVLGGSSGLD